MTEAGREKLEEKYRKKLGKGLWCLGATRISKELVDAIWGMRTQNVRLCAIFVGPHAHNKRMGFMCLFGFLEPRLREELWNTLGSTIRAAEVTFETVCVKGERVVILRITYY